MTASMGAGWAHSSPLMVKNHLMQQSEQSVRRMFPLNVTRRAESGRVLIKLVPQERVLRGPMSRVPSGMGAGMAQCSQLG